MSITLTPVYRTRTWYCQSQSSSWWKNLESAPRNLFLSSTASGTRCLHSMQSALIYWCTTEVQLTNKIVICMSALDSSKRSDDTVSANVMHLQKKFGLSYLSVYIEQTTIRSSSKLFVSTVKPHGPVSKDTISRWVKASLRIAGIDTAVFKPHSTRAAATSAADKKAFRWQRLLMLPHSQDFMISHCSQNRTVTLQGLYWEPKQTGKWKHVDYSKPNSTTRRWFSSSRRVSQESDRHLAWWIHQVFRTCCIVKPVCSHASANWRHAAWTIGSI